MHSNSLVSLVLAQAFIFEVFFYFSQSTQVVTIFEYKVASKLNKKRKVKNIKLVWKPIKMKCHFSALGFLLRTCHLN